MTKKMVSLVILPLLVAGIVSVLGYAAFNNNVKHPVEDLSNVTTATGNCEKDALATKQHYAKTGDLEYLTHQRLYFLNTDDCGTDKPFSDGWSAKTNRFDVTLYASSN